MSKTLTPLVALIGRPNVGKSALFNRLVGRRQALVDATPGLTRDRLYAEVSWRGVAFRIVDTGGLDFSPKDSLSGAISTQVTQAMEEADLSLLICDGHAGPVPLDREVAQWARRWAKPVQVVVNKIDDPKHRDSIYEFSELGLGEPQGISSLHGRQIGELLDQILPEIRRLNQEASQGQEGAQDSSDLLRVAIVGRPNVGKSSLLNCLLKENRVLVSDTPGTTRDPVETLLEYGEQKYLLVDTAGMRAKRRLKTTMDAVARIKAVESIRSADACLTVIEANHPLRKDDLKLLDGVMTTGKPLCLAINKWDLREKSVTLDQVRKGLLERAPFLHFAPLVSTSAKTGYNVLNALEKVAEVTQASRSKVTVGQARKLLDRIVQAKGAPVAVRNAHFIRLWQVGVVPPTFNLLVRVKRSFRDSDLAFFERVIRSEVELQGTPIRIHLLEKRRSGARK